MATTTEASTSFADVAKSLLKLGANSDNLIGEDGLKVDTKVEIELGTKTMVSASVASIFVVIVSLFVLVPIARWFYKKMDLE